jgi:hypothetical protein
MHILLRRFLLTLSGVFVWIKALAGGRGDAEAAPKPDAHPKAGDPPPGA